ncbi:MAG: SDR family oxidoreductase [Kangiellaceae bacterium]|nr:SDR family oxidoreductase [Kangiellaceae bacterium]
MKLTIFGATGSIGKLAVLRALKLGFEVVAFSRKPSKLAIRHSNLQLLAGDVNNLSNVSDAVKHSDAVIVCIGSAKLSGDVRSKGTANIVEAMKQHQIRRLICQSTLGIGNSWQNLNFYWKYIMFGLILKNVFQDHGVQEQIVNQSELDWTIVRPAAFIDQKPKKPVKVGFSFLEKKLSLTIARKDVADFLIAQVTSKQYIRDTPALSY